MFVCSCFGITEQQVKQHADAGACTPREIASACKAGTDCGSCVRRIQGLLGRGTGTPRRPAQRLAAQRLAASAQALPAGSAAPQALSPAAEAA